MDISTLPRGRLLAELFLLKLSFRGEIFENIFRDHLLFHSFRRRQAE